jgi:hypothetical protein
MGLVRRLFITLLAHNLAQMSTEGIIMMGRKTADMTGIRSDHDNFLKT